MCFAWLNTLSLEAALRRFLLRSTPTPRTFKFSTAVLPGALTGGKLDLDANFDVLLSWKEDIGGSCLQ